MAPAYDVVLDQALSLPDEQRRAMAEALLASLDLAAAQDLNALWLREVEARRRAHERGEAGWLSPEEAFRQLRERRAT